MNSENPKSSRVWFITGTSGGTGHELVREVLRRGDSVLATSRDPQKVALAAAVDLGNFGQITKAVQAGISRFGNPCRT
jgi:NAD(P)-dependent dehydrogenase (short-subunit alcohol dehydrogenase family)